MSLGVNPVEGVLVVSLVVLALTLAVLWVWVLRVQGMVQEVSEAVGACSRGLGQLSEVVQQIPGAPTVVLDSRIDGGGQWAEAPAGTETVVMVRARPWRVRARDG